MHPTNQNKIVEILENYQIRYNLQDKLEIEPDQDLRVIPKKKIVNMLGLPKGKGHQAFIEKLNQIECNWLAIFVKYESYYEVYNNEAEIIKENFYILINEILDGLQ